MDTHIDWLSFTLPCSSMIENVSDLYHIAKGLLKGISSEHTRYIFSGEGFDNSVGRAPYRLALEREDGGCKIFGAGALESVLFELSGRGCEGLRGLESTCAFISPLLERITRLDVASDIRCTVSPSNFTNQRAHHAFRSVSFIRSDTGETVYVGSPKSDRFCRVYRYNDPHPRSELLRVEFVFRHGLAKAASALLCEAESWEKFSRMSGNTYGFTHPVWKPEFETTERLRAPIVKREDADTVSWLYKRVAPSIRRLIESGALDWEDFGKFIFSR